MSLPHFFLDDQVLSEESEPVFELRLSGDDLKHAQVLRLAPPEHIAVIDAASDYFECEVASCTKAGVSVRIAEHLEAHPRPRVVLAQGLAKGDKMDFIFRHATELGVEAFVPLLCSRSIVRLDARKTANRMQRWKTLVKSAAMQSGRSSLPEIAQPQTVREFAQTLSGASAVLICWEEAPLTCTLSDALDQALVRCGLDPLDARVVVVVGPEGGLAEEEVACLQRACERSRLITLGPGILRTETAGIVAPALVLYELERRL